MGFLKIWRITTTDLISELMKKGVFRTALAKQGLIIRLNKAKSTIDYYK